jgi:hypothetical protein
MDADTSRSRMGLELMWLAGGAGNPDCTTPASAFSASERHDGSVMQ